jgi:hypothetical protein
MSWTSCWASLSSLHRMDLSSPPKRSRWCSASSAFRLMASLRLPSRSSRKMHSVFEAIHALHGGGVPLH